MVPDLPLARTITRAVMDQIERSRTISSEGITEAVYAKLLYAHATTPPAPANDGEVRQLATVLLEAMRRDTKIAEVSRETATAYEALARAVLT
jgi:hypothetical protein